MKIVRRLLVALVLSALALSASGAMARGDVAAPSGRIATSVPASPQLPSNGLILFASSRSGGGTTQLYTMNANGTGVTQLTRGPGSSDRGAWSPNGQQIAFMSDRSGGWHIYVMNADGSNVVQLTTHVSHTPSWSPNGQQIVYMQKPVPPNGNFDIYVMNADGTDPVRLTTDAPEDCCAAWSPTGAQIVYESMEPGNFDIYTMNTDGSDQTDITNNPTYDGPHRGRRRGRRSHFAAFVRMQMTSGR